MMARFRKSMAIILMVLGIAMIARGLMFTFKAELGWQGIIQAVVVGSLVFFLGFARWRYLRQR